MKDRIKELATDFADFYDVPFKDGLAMAGFYETPEGELRSVHSPFAEALERFGINVNK